MKSFFVEMSAAPASEAHAVTMHDRREACRPDLRHGFLSPRLDAVRWDPRRIRRIDRQVSRVALVPQEG